MQEFQDGQMNKKKMSEMGIRAGECLSRAVLEEYKRKALLGQYVIINHNGKARRVSAKEALKMARSG